MSRKRSDRRRKKQQCNGGKCIIVCRVDRTAACYTCVADGKLLDRTQVRFMADIHFQGPNTEIQTRNIRKRDMGKKDASAQRGQPVEKYRKDIGKHDYNKEKKKLKSSKKASDLSKSSTPLKDGLLVLLTGALLIGGIYFGLYWSLDLDKNV